ncbi:MAG: SiaB family protein kinase [Ekhidna sp.]|uniref:SiaB family protein kinase n=1 Tax=Ekhidna sp. TaxID=2608089 RepID=UPI0032EBC85C
MDNSGYEKVYTQLKHLKNIITFKKLMTDSNVNVVYLGNVTQATIDGVTEMISEDLSVRNENKRVTKRVYHAMMESLQNICKHADSQSDEESNSLEQGLVKKGIFLIGHNESEYFITTGNNIEIKNAVVLRDILDNVNAQDADGLKQLYFQAMENSELGETGGAGLGFIDMAKKTGTKYEYYFEPDSETSCFFILTMRIAKDAEA